METVGFSVGSIGQLKELDEIGGENSFESKYLKNGNCFRRNGLNISIQQNSIDKKMETETG